MDDNKLSYKDLTLAEKRLITNGCGGKGGWVQPPQFRFEASCNWHDFEYWRGGTECDRKKADQGFYEAMKRDANRAKWYKRPFYRLMAWKYYQAVRWFGGRFFYYSPIQRGRAELDRLMVYYRQHHHLSNKIESLT